MVSIIIPYNKDRGFLKQAIDSVKNQNYDGEIELLLSKSDGNVSYNINKALEEATGEYIKYLCEDDWLTPNSIKDSIEAIKGYDFIHGNAYNVRNGNKEIQKPKVTNPSFERMIEMNMIHGGTLMYRKSVFEKVGLFDETIVSAEEYDFNLRCLKLGLKLGYCDKFLYNYRRHDEQKSLGTMVDQPARQLKIKEIQEKWR